MTADRAERDDRLAAALRGFGPIGVAAALAIALLGPVLEPLGAVLALAWAWRSRTPWRDLGFVRSKNWLVTVAVGVVTGVALKLVLKALVMPLLGAPPINPAYHYLAGNPAALPGMFFEVIVGAGFGEELVFRGFLFERLGKLLGDGTPARMAILLVTSAWFGVVHYPSQGLPGAEQAVITGLVFGTIFLITRKLWVPMIAHAAFDITAVLIIFLDLETRVFHLIFR
jgi:membrane protease YdiL (CAAX protease family)